MVLGPGFHLGLGLELVSRPWVWDAGVVVGVVSSPPIQGGLVVLSPGLLSGDGGPGHGGGCQLPSSPGCWQPSQCQPGVHPADLPRASQAPAVNAARPPAVS